MPRKVIAVLSLVALAVSMAAMGPAEAAPQQDAGGPVSERLCEPRSGFDVIMKDRGLGFTEDDTPRYRTWLDDDKLIEAAEPLGDLLDREPAVYGVVMDHEQQSFVVVHDPEMSSDDAKRLSGRIAVVADGNFDAELVPGCHGMADVQKTVEEIARSGESEEVEIGPWWFRTGLTLAGSKS